MTDTHTEIAVRPRVRFDPTRPRGAHAYDHAFRHSRRVKFLKFALPGIAAVALIGFFVTMRFANLSGGAVVGMSGLNIESKSLIMDAPHMSGFDSSRHPYLLKAIKAVQDLVNPKVVTLDRIDAHFATDDTNTANMKARGGVLDGTKNTLALRDGITIETSDGIRATLKDADIDINKGNLVTAKPVEIHTSDGNWLKANGARIENKGAKITFVNGVSVNYLPPPKDDQPAAAATPSATQAAGARLKSATQ